MRDFFAVGKPIAPFRGPGIGPSHNTPISIESLFQFCTGGLNQADLDICELHWREQIGSVWHRDIAADIRGLRSVN